MTLKSYLESGSIVKHQPTKAEIAMLFRIAERDLKLAEKLNDDNDWQFAIAYNAVLQIATIIIRASGYRVASKSGHHWLTLTIFPEFLGKEFRDLSDYFDESRLKRNMTEYKSSGDITLEQAIKLIKTAKNFKKSVLLWLNKKYPQFV